jgi:hypothetical protein
VAPGTRIRGYGRCAWAGLGDGHHVGAHEGIAACGGAVTGMLGEIQQAGRDRYRDRLIIDVLLAWFTVGRGLLTAVPHGEVTDPQPADT